MKPILLLTLAFLCLSASQAHAVILTQGDKDKIEVTFTNKMTISDLEKIQHDMKKKKIDLVYEKVELNKKGKLKLLAFKVDCNDGFSGSAKSKHLKKKMGFGFYRDYREGSPSPFGTGNVNR